jgi:hypothetical protein
LIFLINLPRDKPPNGIPRDFAMNCKSVSVMEDTARLARFLAADLRLRRLAVFGTRRPERDFAGRAADARTRPLLLRFSSPALIPIISCILL